MQTIVISEWLDNVEREYTEFPVTAAGMAAAKEYMEARMNPRFSRGVPASAFATEDDPIGDPEKARQLERAIRAGNLAEVQRLLS